MRLYGIYFPDVHLGNICVRKLTHQPQQVSKSRVYYDLDDTNQVVNVLRIIEKGRDTTPEQNP